ncbi:AMP-binding protein [Gordonia sp. CPCC 206044]|uniref:AMP-binding protein n=1 Tax=Gordonia sp. CPCC 206044 TaxID=3140793 RepID=UPI003AF35356
MSISGPMVVSEAEIAEAAHACESEVVNSFLRQLDRDPNRMAVTDDRASVLTRGELWILSGEIAAEMQSAGLAAGDIVVICMPNRAEWVAAYLATLRCGLVPASLPVTTDPDAIAYVVELVAAQALLLPREHRGRDFAVEAESISAAVSGRLSVATFGDAGQRSWHVFDGPIRSRPVYPDGLAHVLFSSSTTGRSKAIAHSDETLSAYNRGVIDRYGVSEDQSIFMPSPLGHSTGFWHGARMSLLTGAALVLQDRWDPRAALQAVRRHGCSITVAATPFLTDLVDVEWDLKEPKLRGMKVFLCGGAPVSPDLIERAQVQMPDTKIASIWAMSEGGATSSMPDDAPQIVAHGCGRVLPRVLLETIADDGTRNPRGVEGEIVMRTPSQCLGYIGQSALFAESFTEEGYFRTGDLGVVDDAGYLQLTGRLKDLIIRGGVNISPVDIENAVLRHPRIDKVAVIGSPDDRLGERICAVVTLREGTLSSNDLVDWLATEGTPRRLWPEELHVVSSMPETPAGKIRKNHLREMITKEKR